MRTRRSVAYMEPMPLNCSHNGAKIFPRANKLCRVKIKSHSKKTKEFTKFQIFGMSSRKDMNKDRVTQINLNNTRVMSQRESPAEGAVSSVEGLNHIGRKLPDERAIQK
jgi:hypothetical protein